VFFSIDRQLADSASSLQLRTTPKDVPPAEGETEGMTKRQYVEAVLSTFLEQVIFSHMPRH